MARKKIFIFAYYSYLDPVFQSAVLPYFEGLHDANDFEFILLTFEQKRYTLPAHKVEPIHSFLTKQRITWYRCVWHSGKWLGILKAFSFIYGMLYAIYIILKHRAALIYVEGFPGGIFGYFLSRLFRKPLVMHTYEPHSAYMIETGVWKKTYWGGKLLQYYEDKIGLNAAAIMTASNQMVMELKEKGAKGLLLRVPSCVDIQLFNRNEEKGVRIKNQLGIPQDRIVFVYLGKFGGMYLDQETFDFFSLIKTHLHRPSHFLILSGDDPEQIMNWAKYSGLNEESVSICKLTKQEVPDYLSAGDFGFVAVKPVPSKVYCSPIKDGEYWACGLPIITIKGISEDAILAPSKGIGFVLDALDQQSYLAVINQLNDVIHSGKLPIMKQASVAFAHEDRDVNQYKALYVKTFKALTA